MSKDAVRIKAIAQIDKMISEHVLIVRRLGEVYQGIQVFPDTEKRAAARELRDMRIVRRKLVLAQS